MSDQIMIGIHLQVFVLKICMISFTLDANQETTIRAVNIRKHETTGYFYKMSRIIAVLQLKTEMYNAGNYSGNRPYLRGGHFSGQTQIGKIKLSYCCESKKSLLLTAS